MNNQTAEETVLDGDQDGANEERTPACNTEDIPQQSEEEKDTVEADPESKRKRTMTQRAKESKEQELTKDFWRAQRSFTTLTGAAANALKGYCTPLVFDDAMASLTPSCKELVDIYDKIKHVCQTPDPTLRIAVDRAIADKATIVAQFQEKLQDFGDTRSQRSRRSSRLTYRSGGSASTTTRLVEAAANVAAHQAQMEAEQFESQKEAELQAALQLQADADAAELKRKAEAEALAIKQKADAEAEELQRKTQEKAKIDAIRRDLEQQRTKKLLAMEEAKKRVYADELSREQGGATSGLLSKPAPAQYIDSLPAPTHVSSPLSHVPARSPLSHAPSATDYAALAQAISSAVSLNRLPPPEPSIFNGDPLMYHDWSIAFKILIQDKGIPKAEQIHYLKRYLSGPARDAVSGYFLLKSETAFEEAKAVLDKRYGDPFLTAEAFRDKLDSWPKVPSRDGTALRRLADFMHQCNTAMNSNKGLEILNDTREIRRISCKLPQWIADRWCRIVSKTKSSKGIYPAFKEFAKFVANEADIACDPVANIDSLKVQDRPTRKETAITIPKRSNRNIATTLSTGTNAPPSCLFCKDRNFKHRTTECHKLGGISHKEKKEFVLQHKLCYACLKPGHMISDCPKKAKCKSCEKPHPTSMHPINQRQAETASRSNDHTSPNSDCLDNTSSNTIGTGKGNCGRVMSGDVASQMLSTIVPVWVSTKEDPKTEHMVYALLDTMSDTTFVLDDTFNKLNATSEDVALKLSTMASKSKTIYCQKVFNLVVRGYDSDTRISLPPAYSRGFIPVDRSHIPTPESVQDRSHLNQVSKQLLPLQDCEVGLLIGYNCPQALAPRDTAMGGSLDPFGMRTDLGWSVVGCLDIREDSGDAIGVTHRVYTTEIPLELQHKTETKVVVPKTQHYAFANTVREDLSPLHIVSVLENDFKSIEADDLARSSQDDTKFLEIVSRGIRHDEGGNLIMPLPFKEEPTLLNNRSVALSRFKNLERRFKFDPTYCSDYRRFMSEVFEHGDAERIPAGDSAENCWYIPHHGVYHPKKPDKIRVVFDCSAKYRGQSLNDYLLQGPDLANGLIGILCRFRQEPVAIMCDIERMFHQFKVETSHRDYLRFLWYDDKNGIVDYRMKVHIFGATSSPGCANYALKHLASSYQEEFPEAATFIQRNFYVDDGLKSLESNATAVKLVKDAQKLCSRANLRLHKFVSNSREVMESIPRSEIAKDFKDLDLSLETLPIERALGVHWSVENDYFHFRLILKDQPLTRRGVLSTVASVYDPLGFLAPFVLVGKQILQDMCKANLGWDDSLTDDLRTKWERWRADLPNLRDFKVDRCFKPKDSANIARYEMHHFSDASTTGYGQASYLRLMTTCGKVHCSFVMGKARVTPRKLVTIPRLELQAAVVSTKVSALLKKEIEYESVSHFFWTDSKVVLGYIANESSRFHVFVANRVQQIRDRSNPSDWHYVSTDKNPADLASRGSSANDLILSNWLTGPDFLWQLELPSTKPPASDLDVGDPEVKRVTSHLVNATNVFPPYLEPERLERCEDLHLTQKVIAHCLRLKALMRARKVKKPALDSIKTPLAYDNIPTISVSEMIDAERAIVQCTQRYHFKEEISRLSFDEEENEDSRENIRQRKILCKSSSLRALDPFVDAQGTLRVGGRISRASMPFELKNPLILPKCSFLTKQLISRCHAQVNHMGRHTTHNELRQRGYWIISGSSAVAHFISRCVICKRMRGECHRQKMADLPSDRLEPAPPFTYCATDYFGPFIVKERRKEIKRYGVIFVCLASRAIHLEVANSLETDDFINVLRRFICRRGPVRQIRSDQGTNFVGARNELQKALSEMDHENIQARLNHDGCDWVSFKMNVPHASHMGGIWERQIRTVRSALGTLLRGAGSQLCEDSLRTFMAEAEYIVNSKPITTANLSSPDAPEPLTANHLLTMKSKIVLPPPGNFPKEDLYCRKRWRRVQYLANEFWSRWKKEYLQSLQSRTKWTSNVDNLGIGDIVLVKDDTLPRNCWKMARVAETYPSEDGFVRKVRLLLSDTDLTTKGKRTKHQTYLERPIHKLVLLLKHIDHEEI